MKDTRLKVAATSSKARMGTRRLFLLSHQDFRNFQTLFLKSRLKSPNDLGIEI